jgi:hypothetical protein
MVEGEALPQRFLVDDLLLYLAIAFRHNRGMRPGGCCSCGGARR